MRHRGGSFSQGDKYDWLQVADYPDAIPHELARFERLQCF